MEKVSKLLFISCVFLMFSTLFMFNPRVVQATSVEASVLKQGAVGEEVSRLQTKLKEYGYYQDEVDGNFGTATYIAVLDFQVDCGLEADGVVGSETLLRLKEFRMQNSANRGGLGRRGRQMVEFAKQYLGVPYVWAGNTGNGFDCSGFVCYIFSQYGYSIPRMADEQFEIGMGINQNELQLGDLVFFSTYEPGPSHVGIYIGNGQFIHASSGAGMVTITSLSKNYYQSSYLGARRILK